MRAITQDEMNVIADEVNDLFFNTQEDEEWEEYRKVLLSLGAVRAFELLEAKGYKIIKISRSLH